MYSDTKIERFELWEGVRDKVDSTSDFDAIDNFKTNIEKYIYTEIEITDYREPIQKSFQCRLQQVMSESLLRALMLKEGMVQALNSNNFPTYYAALKSFLEIPAVLGYLAHTIYKQEDYEKIIPQINTLHLGNRKAGSFPVGSVEAINVLTMFGKLDKVIKEMACEGKTAEERKEIIGREDVLTTVYSDVCNFGHTNFNANMSVGILGKDGIWRGKRDSDGYKRELWAFYMTGFTIGISTIEMLCNLIVRNPKVQNFGLLNSKPYFGPLGD